jgi:hypothetical protein
MLKKVFLAASWQETYKRLRSKNEFNNPRGRGTKKESVFRIRDLI